MYRTLSKRMSDAQTIRTFLAVAIPQREREVLAALIGSLEPERALLKLVNADLLHITLRFLGPVAANHMERVVTAALTVAEAARPFALTLSGVGAFPNERAPRVLWMGIGANDGLDALRRLAGAVEDALVAEGFAPETRAFSPHITLARSRDQISVTERRQIADALRRVGTQGLPARPFEVRELIVMRSDPGPSGPRYTPLLIAPLTGPPAVG